jgi:hypothetical protein
VSVLVHCDYEGCKASHRDGITGYGGTWITVGEYDLAEHFCSAIHLVAHYIFTRNVDQAVLATMVERHYENH